MMGVLENLPGAARDHAGLISVPVAALRPGCKGPSCPAFATCQGHARKRRAVRVAISTPDPLSRFADDAAPASH